jgi:hypothetical protein
VKHDGAYPYLFDIGVIALAHTCTGFNLCPTVKGPKRVFVDEMAKKRDVPTAEEVATAVDGDVVTAQRALRAVKFNDDKDE